MVGNRQGIGLFGGSFDPVHNGHLSIARSFLKSEFISELWILLTPDPPHKPDEELSSYGIRLEMLQHAFRNIDNVVVRDIEKHLPKPSYTVQTLEFLSEKYPDKKFFLCIGEDSLSTFKSWYQWHKILDYCELLVARRPLQEEVEPKKDLAAKIHYVEHEPIAVSSTQIRDHKASGRTINKMVPPEVNRLISKYNLYNKR